MEGLTPPLPTAEMAERMSLGARLMNIFSGPGEVFAQVKKGSPSTANWLVPVLLSCTIGVGCTFIIFSQDAVMQQIRDQKQRVIEKKWKKSRRSRRKKSAKRSRNGAALQ